MCSARAIQHYWKVDFRTELTDEAIAAHIEHGKKTPHISSSMHLHPINAAAQRVGVDETAFGHRDKNFSLVVGEYGRTLPTTRQTSSG
jgi:hypothetical protein